MQLGPGNPVQSDDLLPAMVHNPLAEGDSGRARTGDRPFYSQRNLGESPAEAEVRERRAQLVKAIHSIQIYPDRDVSGSDMSAAAHSAAALDAMRSSMSDEWAMLNPMLQASRAYVHAESGRLEPAAVCEAKPSAPLLCAAVYWARLCTESCCSLAAALRCLVRAGTLPEVAAENSRDRPWGIVMRLGRRVAVLHSTLTMTWLVSVLP